MVDLNKSITPEINNRLQDASEKIKRMASKAGGQELDARVAELEQIFHRYCLQVKGSEEAKTSMNLRK